MKIEKINIFSAVLFSLCILLSVQDASGQGNGQNFKDKTPEQRAQFQTNMMKTKLGLDSIQTLKVRDINFKYAQKLDLVLQGDDGRLTRFRELKAIQQQKNKELKIVFNKDQYKQYEKLEAELKEKFRENAQSRNQ